jgi:hypothetical protein
MSLFPWFLFAHILGAIVAFGPSFAMPIIGGMGGKEPPHGNFGLRVMLAISQQRIIPLAILQGITGIGLIIAGNVDLLAARWLLVGIVLYAVALWYAMGVQTPTVKLLIEMTAGGPPPAGAAPAAGAPSGPPPALLAAVKKAQRGGLILAGLVTAIVFLMVLKPF